MEVHVWVGSCAFIYISTDRDQPLVVREARKLRRETAQRRAQAGEANPWTMRPPLGHAGRVLSRARLRAPGKAKGELLGAGHLVAAPPRPSPLQGLPKVSKVHSGVHSHCKAG